MQKITVKSQFGNGARGSLCFDLVSTFGFYYAFGMTVPSAYQCTEYLLETWIADPCKCSKEGSVPLF